MLILFAVGFWWHGGIDPKYALLLIGLCFFCELVDSGLGMGYGTMLTPALLLLGYEVRDIVPTVLLSELLSGFTAAFFHHEIKNVQLGFKGRDFGPAVILAAGSVVGVSAGVFIAVNASKTMLNLGIGFIILFSGLLVILMSRRAIVYRRWKMLLLATVASFNKAVSGGGYGPLVTSGQVLSGVAGKSAVGITSFAEAFTCLAAVSLLLMQGGWISMVIFIPMACGALLSVPFAVFVIKQTNENRLKLVIGVITVSMGILTIAKALP
ncbi:MAG: sulfite exporter TauE/SafE family protein [Cephaloticoccus sp.]|nr:sulfite exporter TauE/SafE family protein [Cephaloticoccus sp.]